MRIFVGIVCTISATAAMAVPHRHIVNNAQQMQQQNSSLTNSSPLSAYFTGNLAPLTAKLAEVVTAVRDRLAALPAGPNRDAFERLQTMVGNINQNTPYAEAESIASAAMQFAIPNDGSQALAVTVDEIRAQLRDAIQMLRQRDLSADEITFLNNAPCP